METRTLELILDLTRALNPDLTMGLEIAEKGISRDADHARPEHGELDIPTSAPNSFPPAIRTKSYSI